MVVANQSFELFVGNRRILEFIVDDEDNPGSVLNLSGYTIRFALAAFDRTGSTRLRSLTPIVASPLIDLNSAGAQVTIVDAGAGRVDVELLGSDTVNFSSVPDDYYFELEAIDPSGNSVVVATGTAVLKRNVTNA